MMKRDIRSIRLNKDLFTGLFILCLSFYYSIGVLWTGEVMTGSQTRLLWAISLIAIFVSYLLVSGFRFPKFKKWFCVEYFALLLFISFALFSASWAKNSNQVVSRGSFVLKIIISGILISIMINSRKNVRSILKSIEYGGDIAIIYTIAANGLSSMIAMFLRGSRLSYTGTNSNVLGGVAAFSVVICIYFLTVEGWRISSLFAIPCMLIVILSVSKKAIFAMFFGAFMYIVLINMNKKGFIKNMLKVVAIIIVSAFALYFILKLPFLAAVEQRVEAMFSGLAGGLSSSGIDRSTMERLSLIESGKTIIHKHPIIGVGLDNARFYNTYGVYLHNNYLELMADLGIVGAFLYYSVYLGILKNYVKYRNFIDKEYDICLTLLILVLILDWGRVTYYDLETYYFISLLLAESKNIERGEKAIIPYTTQTHELDPVGLR